MIKGFHQEGYEFLSNFYPSPFYYKEVLWPSVENAYQWYKSEDPETLELFKVLKPGKAKRMGSKLPKYEMFEKLSIMRDLVLQKFLQNPDLAQKLLDTGNQEIEEFNNWDDTFWGVINNDGCEIGQNNLGGLLMSIRMKLRGEGLDW